MLLTPTLAVHTDLPFYKLEVSKTMALTSVFDLLRALKHTLLIAEFQEHSVATKTRQSRPLRDPNLSATSIPSKDSFIQPPPSSALRMYTQDFWKRAANQLKVRKHTQDSSLR